MPRLAFRDLIEKMFPSDEGRKRTNELVTRGVEALRLARDERGFAMGDTMRVPSRLELRLPQDRYDELASMDAMRDLEFFFNDELMKDLAAEKLRTFGDHAVHVTIAVDPSLQPDEIYAMVLTPENEMGKRGSVRLAGSPQGRGAAAQESTRVLGDESASTQTLDAATRGYGAAYHLRISGPGGYSHEERLEGAHWIIGRRGSSGRPLPAGYRKLDIEVRETISREQVKVDLFDDRIRIERIGKAPVGLSKRDLLGEGENRVLALGAPFVIEDYEVVISR
jgi:hypothetical protein